jgi:hypothetical protein
MCTWGGGSNGTVFLRFTTTLIHKDSQEPEGVFAAASRLLNSGELDSAERERLSEILIWFNKHLPRPPKTFGKTRAIFWFRSTASDCTSLIWDLVHMLRAHGYHISVHRCARLANICYRDELQVAAYPSDRDGRITSR